MDALEGQAVEFGFFVLFCFEFVLKGIITSTYSGILYVYMDTHTHIYN